MQVELQASQDVLLAQIENKGLAVETQCRSGFCGACRARLVRGQVSYDDTPLAFVSEGEVLICCAKAQTDVTLEL